MELHWSQTSTPMGVLMALTLDFCSVTGLAEFDGKIRERIKQDIISKAPLRPINNRADSEEQATGLNRVS